MWLAKYNLWTANNAVHTICSFVIGNYSDISKLFQQKLHLSFVKKLPYRCNVCNKTLTKTIDKSYFKPATDDSQNSREHISWLSHEKKVCARELPTHVSQLVLFSCAVVSEVISSTSSRENSFVSQSDRFYCETTWNTKREKSVLWSNLKEHEKPLLTLHVSCTFMLQICFMAFSRVVCSQIYTLFAIHHVLWFHRCFIFICE